MLISALATSCGNKTEKPATPKDYTLTIKGSDTEFELIKALCSEFAETDSLNYTVEGGGTELGIKAMLNGEIEMATASREITEHEKSMFAENHIKVLPIMFASDAVAIITYPKLGVDSLTLEQLSKIYTGEYTNWKEVGGPDRKITVYSRNHNSGTYHYFKNKVVHGEFVNSAIICETTKDIVHKVSTDESGIGYTGTGFLLDTNGKPSGKIWAMPISIDSHHNAYSPYETQEVKNGNYALTRPLYQYYKLPLHEKAKDFVLHELTKKGQEMVVKFGYFPINDYQKEINKLNGLNL